MYWAIAAGIEGNLTAYEALLKDLRQSQLQIEVLYLLGDVVGPRKESIKVIDRIQNPRLGEPEPLVCQGWWEEQCLILHALGRTSEPTQLFDRYGRTMAKTLWDAVSRDRIEWIRNLEFGFAELDCLFIHGTSVDVDEALTPETPVMTMVDRLQRMGVNNLFCGRSGQAFEYKLVQGSMQTQVTKLDQPPSAQKVTLPAKRLIGVGNIGHAPGEASYVLYNPGNNSVKFKTVKYIAARGFAAV
jgi:hypothetical protein